MSFLLGPCSLFLVFASAKCIGLKQVPCLGKQVLTREGRELPKLFFKGKTKFYVLHNKRSYPLRSIECLLYEPS